jgi:cholesterol transport system auxiliary component
MPASVPAGASLLAVLSAAIALSGCGSAPKATFDLRDASPPERTHVLKMKRGTSVSVAEPNAEQLLNTNRLVIREEAGNLAYLADVQWTDRAPRLVQGRFIERLVHDGVDASFPRSSAGALLATDLRRFEIDAAKGAAVVEITARLEQNGALRGEAVFLGKAPAAHTAGPEAERAFSEALDDAASQLAKWVRRQI